MARLTMAVWPRIAWGGITQQALQLIAGHLFPIRDILRRTVERIEKGTYRPRQNLPPKVPNTHRPTAQAAQAPGRHRKEIRVDGAAGAAGPVLPRPCRGAPQGARHGGAAGDGPDHPGPADPVALLVAEAQTPADPGEAQAAPTSQATVRGSARGGTPGRAQRGTGEAVAATTSPQTPTPPPRRRRPAGPSKTEKSLRQAGAEARAYCYVIGTKIRPATAPAPGSRSADTPP